MILQLLKKDCIIAKNYVAAVILIGVGLPVLLVWKQPQMLEVFALPGAVFISSVAFNLAVSEKENMYPKATALLCATPYNRGKLVEEKYLLYFLIYLYCCVAFRIEMEVIPSLPLLISCGLLSLFFGFRLFVWAYSFPFNTDSDMKKQSYWQCCWLLLALYL